MLPIVMKMCYPRGTLCLGRTNTCLHELISDRSSLKKIPEILKWNSFTGSVLKISVPLFRYETSLLIVLPETYTKFFTSPLADLLS